MSYNPYQKYSGSWWRFWTNLPSDVWHFVLKMYAYAPLLWDDRDFDHAYLLRMMRFKIRRMRDNMERYAIIAHKEDCVAEMAQADVLLRNVVDEDPDDEWSQHHSQWHCRTELNKPCPQSEKACRAACMASMRRERRNWHRLWKHFDKYLGGWWD